MADNLPRTASKAFLARIGAVPCSFMRRRRGRGLAPRAANRAGLGSAPGLSPLSRRVHIGDTPREEGDARDGRGADDRITSGARRGLRAGSGEDLQSSESPARGRASELLLATALAPRF